MARVLERGSIRFRALPSIDGNDRERRFHVRMRPSERLVERNLVFGRRALPAAGGREQAWAVVDAVGDRLPGEEAPARGTATAATGGSYVIAAHGEHTHLAYALAPDGPRVSYLVTVKNPEALVSMGAPLAEFPPALRERFGGGARFVPLDPPEFLDHVGAELALVGAPEDVWEALGIPLDA